MKLLWISPYAPYDTVGHGGGQNHNYYLKYLKKNTDFDITLLSVCNSDEVDALDLDDYAIDNIVKVYKKNEFSSYMCSLLERFVLYRDGGLYKLKKFHLLMDAINEYVLRGDIPDVIITQWTEVAVLYDYIKPLFPKAKFIAIEEDVAFLGFKRKYENSKGLIKFYKKIKYQSLKKAEIKSLHKFDVVVALNEKDKKLLLDEGIEENKILRMCSHHGYCQNYTYNPDRYQLLFYGAMGRPENYLSAIWFIENVMPLLDDKFKLVVAGSNPNKDLLKYNSDRIIITGFVESMQEYFEHSLCLASPLLLGAGIKIKVLEALSAGLPVVTNSVGAEGIGLTNNENYLHCETPEEYVDAINRLSSNEELRSHISESGKLHVSEYFDADRYLDNLIDEIVK